MAEKRKAPISNRISLPFDKAVEGLVKVKPEKPPRKPDAQSMAKRKKKAAG